MGRTSFFEKKMTMAKGRSSTSREKARVLSNNNSCCCCDTLRRLITPEPITNRTQRDVARSRCFLLVFSLHDCIPVSVFLFLYFSPPSNGSNQTRSGLLLGYFLLNKVPSIHFSARFPNHFYLNTKHSLCVCVCVTLTKMPMTNKIVDQKRKRKNLVLRLCISSEPLIRRR